MYLIDLRGSRKKFYNPFRYVCLLFLRQEYCVRLTPFYSVICLHFFFYCTVSQCEDILLFISSFAICLDLSPLHFHSKLDSWLPTSMNPILLRSMFHVLLVTCHVLFRSVGTLTSPPAPTWCLSNPSHNFRDWKRDPTKLFLILIFLLYQTESRLDRDQCHGSTLSTSVPVPEFPSNLRWRLGLLSTTTEPGPVITTFTILHKSYTRCV